MDNGSCKSRITLFCNYRAMFSVTIRYWYDGAIIVTSSLPYKTLLLVCYCYGRKWHEFITLCPPMMLAKDIPR